MIGRILKIFRIASMLLLVFFIGIFIGSSQKNEMPLSLNELNPFSSKAPEKLSPFDWIKESQIDVYNDKVIINIENPEWAGFADTNSMDPLIDRGANAIQIVPKTEEDVHIGDVISYKPNNSEGIIIHRVIKIGQDEKGKYFITKGDNNSAKDPEKVRFYQIRKVLVGVIY